MSEHTQFQSRLLKKTIPDLAPFFGYVIADLIWGKALGFFVGAALGALGFVFRLGKEHKSAWFLLGDTVIFALLGAFAVYIPNGLFLRLKPAIIEAVFALGLSIPALVSGQTLTRWVTNSLDGYPLDKNTMASLRKSLRVLTSILWVHFALSIWAGLEATDALWRFVSGGLLYLLLAAALGVLWLVNRKKSRPASTRSSISSDREHEQEVRWACFVMSDRGDIFAAKIDRSASDSDLWDTPLRGVAGSSAELVRQLNLGLSRLGIDPAAVRARTGEPVMVEPLFQIEIKEGAEVRCLAMNPKNFNIESLFVPTEAASKPKSQDEPQNEPQNLSLSVYFGITLDPKAFPRGLDPTERRFMSTRELKALKESEKLSPRFARELEILLNPPKNQGFTSDEASSIVEEDHALL
ncbi:MAG TPA: hypothetical protein PLT87_05080 [Spirochaetales bacterium]|nr:hypothetical protein [Spirochaetales bacterium]